MSGSVIVSSFRNVCFVINAALEEKLLHGCGRPLPQRKESSPVYDAIKCRGNPDRTGGIGTGRQRPPRHSARAGPATFGGHQKTGPSGTTSSCSHPLGPL